MLICSIVFSIFSYLERMHTVWKLGEFYFAKFVSTLTLYMCDMCMNVDCCGLFPVDRDGCVVEDGSQRCAADWNGLWTRYHRAGKSVLGGPEQEVQWCRSSLPSDGHNQVPLQVASVAVHAWYMFDAVNTFTPRLTLLHVDSPCSCLYYFNALCFCASHSRYQ